MKPHDQTEIAYKNGYEKGYSDAIAQTKQKITDKDINVPSKWIPVTERLPNRDDMVIAFYPTMCGTTGEMQIHKAWAMSETCTHWMPLPEPPKGE